jgi:hypothetical protein
MRLWELKDWSWGWRIRQDDVKIQMTWFLKILKGHGEPLKNFKERRGIIKL